MSLNIVVIGAGEVGFNLAKSLSKEDHDITVIDVSPDRCDRVKNAIDAKVIEGSGSSQRTLQKIDMQNVDYLLALTKIDEVNFVSSYLAHALGAKKIICRLRNTEYSHKTAVITPGNFNINHVVFPEKAAQREIESLIRQTSAVEIEEFREGKITLVGINLEQSSPLIGRTVEQIKIANPYISHQLCVIYRHDESFIPHQNTIYKKNDFVYFLGKSEDINKIQQMSGRPAIKVNNVMILGAGKVGRLLAKSLQTDYNVRIIEKDSDKAKKYSEKLIDTLMLIGDGLNTDFLESENIADVDCFIAATESEETNILASLIVKHYGVKQVILHINTTSYLKSVRRIGVDSVLSKNISAVNEVIKIIKSDQQSMPVWRFDEIDIESIEVKVSKDSKYINKKYTISDIPENISLGAIIRNGNIYIPDQHIEILPDDELLLFSKAKNIEKAESLFT